MLTARNFFWVFDDFLIDNNLRDVLSIQGEILASLLVLTCKMRKNGVQLASTFVLLKPGFCKIFLKREILNDRLKFLSWT
jgi:hypothetical protein